MRTQNHLRSGARPGNGRHDCLLQTAAFLDIYLVSAVGSEGSLEKDSFHRVLQELKCSSHWKNLTPGIERSEEPKETSAVLTACRTRDT